MYNALNEDFMFQEMKDRADAHARRRDRQDTRRRCRPPLVAQGGHRAR